MNLTYEKCGDYLIPNIIPDPEPGEELRKFGLMRKNYLKGNYSAPRLGYINFWSKQRKYNFCFIIALLRKVDNFSM